jgi:2-keto-4-pentenoate hydratase/2-oxohepta-3-ene-1,7-dioic acid hydratase in catechol pathway
VKIVRCRVDGREVYAMRDGDQLMALEGDPPFDRVIGQWGSVEVLAPCQPSKIVAIGRNYVAHAQEHGADVPEYPLIFLKPASAIIGPDTPIWLPPQSKQVEHESELAVVIGREARRVEAEKALEHVLGYTCGNDVTARDLQRTDGQWTRAKGFDTFCPLGPWIETELDPRDLAVSCRVNGEVRQAGRTSQLVFDVPYLISYISHIMTLMPGDVIMTGTPAGVGPLRAGDVVEVEIDGLGILRNPVDA